MTVENVLDYMCKHVLVMIVEKIIIRLPWAYVYECFYWNWIEKSHLRTTANGRLNYDKNIKLDGNNTIEIIINRRKHPVHIWDDTNRFSVEKYSYLWIQIVESQRLKLIDESKLCKGNGYSCMDDDVKIWEFNTDNYN